MKKEGKKQRSIERSSPNKSNKMEKEEKKQRLMRGQKVDFLIQWGKQKRLRCVKHSSLNKSNGEVKRKTTSRIDHPVVKSEKDAPFLPPTRLLISETSQKFSLMYQNWRICYGEEVRVVVTGERTPALYNGRIRIGRKQRTSFCNGRSR